MDETSNLAKVQQLLQKAESEISSAKQILQAMIGEVPEAGEDKTHITQKAKELTTTQDGKIVEGVFDGQNMVGPDGRIYPVPANYASKSKLIEGDVLKLTISPDGSFIYKQIGPVERKRILGTLAQDEKGDYKVIAEGKAYRVLLASLTYYKAEPGDQVTIIIPEEKESNWAAVENVIKAGEEVPDYTGPSYEPEGSASDDGDNDSKEGADQEERQVRIVADDLE